MADQMTVMDVENKIVQGKKGAVAFSMIIFSACFVAGCIHLFYVVRYIEVLQIASFLFLGILYAAVSNAKAYRKQAFSYALILAAVLVVSLGIFYSVKGSLNFIDIVFLVSAFLLPSIIMEAWHVYNLILHNNKPEWFYSKDIPEEPLFVYLENKPILVKMIIDGKPVVVIPSIAPLSVKLGMTVFYVIKKEVQENNGDWRHIFLKENGESYNWHFYTTRFGFMKTYYNPDETLYENRISSNAMIVAKRID